MKLGDLGGLHAALLACFLAALSARELILLSARAKKPAEVPARQTDNSISAEWGGALLPCCTTAAAGGVVGPPHLHALVHRLTVFCTTYGTAGTTLAWNSCLCFPTLGLGPKVRLRPQTRRDANEGIWAFMLTCSFQSPTCAVHYTVTGQ